MLAADSEQKQATKAWHRRETDIVTDLDFIVGAAARDKPSRVWRKAAHLIVGRIPTTTWLMN